MKEKHIIKLTAAGLIDGRVFVDGQEIPQGTIRGVEFEHMAGDPPTVTLYLTADEIVVEAEAELVEVRY